MTSVYIWIAACILFIVLEAATATLVSIWFIGGSIAALIAALCDGPVWLQIGLFGVVSALLLLCLRPFLRKFVTPGRRKTNVESNVGKQGVVIETIDNLHGKGRIALGSVDWTARSMDGSVIEEGARVIIRKVEGVRAYVERD